MANEQILNKILEKLETMDNRLSGVENEMGSIRMGQSSIEQQLIAFQQFTMEQFTKIDLRFTKMDARFDKMDDRFDKMDDRFDKMDDRFDNLEEKVTKISITIENEIKPSIKAITEQLDDHSRILNRHTEQLERIEDKVTHHDIKISILDKTKSNKRIAKAK